MLWRARLVGLSRSYSGGVRVVPHKLVLVGLAGALLLASGTDAVGGRAAKPFVRCCFRVDVEVRGVAGSDWGSEGRAISPGPGGTALFNHLDGVHRFTWRWQVKELASYSRLADNHLEAKAIRIRGLYTERSSLVEWQAKCMIGRPQFPCAHGGRDLDPSHFDWTTERPDCAQDDVKQGWKTVKVPFPMLLLGIRPPSNRVAIWTPFVNGQLWPALSGAGRDTGICPEAQDYNAGAFYGNVPRPVDAYGVDLSPWHFAVKPPKQSLFERARLFDNGTWTFPKTFGPKFYEPGYEHTTHYFMSVFVHFRAFDPADLDDEKDKLLADTRNR